MDENNETQRAGISSPYICRSMSEQLAYLRTRVGLMTPAHLHYRRQQGKPRISRAIRSQTPQPLGSFSDVAMICRPSSKMERIRLWASHESISITILNSAYSSVVVTMAGGGRPAEKLWPGPTQQQIIPDGSTERTSLLMQHAAAAACRVFGSILTCMTPKHAL